MDSVKQLTKLIMFEFIFSVLESHPNARIIWTQDASKLKLIIVNGIANWQRAAKVG